jgi:6-phosphogluconolactonase (cycloisomerase 2 family)
MSDIQRDRFGIPLRLRFYETPELQKVITRAASLLQIDITPDGKYVIASNTGAGKNNADQEVVIDATGPHPHVVDIMSPGIGPEGFAIAPNGKYAATPLLMGTGAKASDWFHTDSGELVVMSIGAGGKLTVTGHAKLGKLAEGIVFSNDSNYIYVGNYTDRDLQIFKLISGKPVQIGPNMKLPGQPASMRGPVR